MEKLFSRVLQYCLAVVVLFASHQVQANDDHDKKDSLSAYHWIHLDPIDDKVAGIGLNKAYQLLEGRPSRKIRVAVIDSGFDLDHPDLENKFWTNEDEIPGNGIDDDGNGYIDDIHGWNFIGGDEKNVVYDSYELTREYIRLSKKFADADEGKGEEYEYWTEIRDKYESGLMEAEVSFARYKAIINNIPRYYQLLKSYIDVDTLTFEQVTSISTEDSVIEEAAGLIGKLLKHFGDGANVNSMVEAMEKGFSHYEYQIKYGYNRDFDPRPIVSDDYNNKKEKYYGNPDVDDYSGMMGSHGTHVAGIIASIRDNDFGAIGVVEDVEIMALRTVPNGDERDKDVANAIYYAVDNGASIINMSFGKSYSPDRQIVEKAIRYAEKKDVLIVHAAGNDAENKDMTMNYPTRRFVRGKKEASNMIEVAANSRNLNEQLPAKFTNYGKRTVDLFAPGVSVFSPVPENEYRASSGTSMASPVVAGVAALLKSYFPDLTAREIKEIMMQSVVPYEGNVYLPGTEEEVPFSNLTISGGIVNAYEAVKIAQNRIKLNSR
ncbi:MAG: S8 family peptidase [Cyclobacteriaceae bacterium]|nr:S8 family peptidase [Cyclobacteriaceae bacterium]